RDVVHVRTGMSLRDVDLQDMTEPLGTVIFQGRETRRQSGSDAGGEIRRMMDSVTGRNDSAVLLRETRVHGQLVRCAMRMKRLVEGLHVVFVARKDLVVWHSQNASVDESKRMVEVASSIRIFVIRPGV